MFEIFLEWCSTNWEDLIWWNLGIISVLLALVFSVPQKVRESFNQLTSRKNISLLASVYLFVFLSIYILTVIGAFVEKFHKVGLQDKLEHWGQVGDFFGGMLNPVLAFASFIALLYTVRLQAIEMDDTRKAFEKSEKVQQTMLQQSLDQPVLQIIMQSMGDVKGYFEKINNLYNRDIKSESSSSVFNIDSYIRNHIPPMLAAYKSFDGVDLICVRSDVMSCSPNNEGVKEVIIGIHQIIGAIVSELHSQKQLLNQSPRLNELLNGRYMSLKQGIIHIYADLALFSRLNPQEVDRSQAEVQFENDIIEKALLHLSASKFQNRQVNN